MEFDPPLHEAILLRRYKRFLADVELAEGEQLTVHTPNTGSMLGCCTPGSRVWLRDSGNPNRKYRFSWEIVEAVPGTLVGINTGLVNQLVSDAVESGVINELQGYARLRKEVRYGSENSRIDLLFEQGPDDRNCYVEIKNVTAVDSRNSAIFPDAVTERGTKHLRELMGMVAAGHRAVIFFCVQRGDPNRFRPADEIDPVYATTLRKAMAAGVEAMAYRAVVEPTGIHLSTSIVIDC